MDGRDKPGHDENRTEGPTHSQHYRSLVVAPRIKPGDGRDAEGLCEAMEPP